MTQPAVLGELLGLAEAHLRTAAVPAAGQGPDQVAAALDQAARVARALSRYLDDIVAGNQAEVLLTLQPGTLLHSAAHARLALRRAAGSFRTAAQAAGSPRMPDGGPAAELAQAAGCLTAGRDLLASHIATDDEGIRSATSWWSAAVTSVPVSGALLDHIAGQARLARTWADAFAHYAAGHSGSPRVVAAELGKARRWLDLAAAAGGEHRRSRPAAKLQAAVLHAIPASIVPGRQPPQAGEPAGVLGDGIAVTAERLRAWAWRQEDDAGLQPGLTADSWRWTATAAAVACDVTGSLIASLSARSRELEGRDGQDGAALARAARIARNACTAWRHVTTAWGAMTTETAGLTSPVIPDTGDLVIRLGRLAFTDPEWSPARAKEAKVRDDASLAPGMPAVRTVLAAVHHAASGLAALAEADQKSVAAVISTGALYMPTRALPEVEELEARYFWRASAQYTAPLGDAYAGAARETSRLARALGTAALRLGGPSQALALATQSASSHSGLLPPARPLPARGAVKWIAPRSSVEGVIRQLGVHDPMLLLRAMAVDKAARQVITQARTATRTTGREPASHTASGTVSARIAAAIAAENFPQPAARPSGSGEKGSRAADPASPAIRPGTSSRPASQGKPRLPR